MSLRGASAKPAPATLGLVLADAHVRTEVLMRLSSHNPARRLLTAGTVALTFAALGRRSHVLRGRQPQTFSAGATSARRRPRPSRPDRLPTLDRGRGQQRGSDGGHSSDRDRDGRCGCDGGVRSRTARHHWLRAPCWPCAACSSRCAPPPPGRSSGRAARASTAATEICTTDCAREASARGSHPGHSHVRDGLERHRRRRSSLSPGA